MLHLILVNGLNIVLVNRLHISLIAIGQAEFC
jgi:hypothetical protein